MTKAKMPVVIRPLTRADYTAWRGLWTAYLAFYGTSVTETVAQTTFDRLTGDAPGEFHARFAVEGDRAVGLVHYLFHRHCWRIENACYLQDLYTDASVRGRGVGRALIEAVYAEADAAAAPHVWWLTQHFNSEARRLYDRVGRLSDFIRYDRPPA